MIAQLSPALADLKQSVPGDVKQLQLNFSPEQSLAMAAGNGCSVVSIGCSAMDASPAAQKIYSGDMGSLSTLQTAMNGAFKYPEAGLMNTFGPSELPLLWLAPTGAVIDVSGNSILAAAASRSGTAVISAGINAGSQYLQNGTVNPIDVAFSAATGYAGTYGGLTWNVGVNAVGAGAGTWANNKLYGKDDSIIGNIISSVPGSVLGYGAGVFAGQAIGNLTRPTINSDFLNGSWNLFLPNNLPAVFSTGVSGGSSEFVNAYIQKLQAGSKK